MGKWMFYSHGENGRRGSMKQENALIFKSFCPYRINGLERDYANGQKRLSDVCFNALLNYS